MKLVEDDNQTFGAEDENFESMLEDGNIWDNQTLIEYKAEDKNFESMLEDGNIWDNQTLIEYKAESQESYEHINDLIAFYGEGILLTTVSIFGLIGNIMSIIVLTRSINGRTSGGNHINIGLSVGGTSFSNLLRGLATFDALFLLVAIMSFGMPRLSDYYMKHIFNHIMIFAYGFLHTFRVGSVYVTLAVTFERFHAIICPLRHFKRKKYMLPACIVFAVVYNLPKYFELQIVYDPKLRYTSTALREDKIYATLYVFWSKFILIEFIPYSIILIMNIFIIIKITKSIRFRRRFQRGQSQSTNEDEDIEALDPSKSTSNGESNSGQQSKSETYTKMVSGSRRGRDIIKSLVQRPRRTFTKKQIEEHNLGIILIVMSSLFIFCQSFKIIPDMYEIFQCNRLGKYGGNCEMKGPVINAIIRLSHILVCVNSSANFLIYYVRGEKFRLAWIETFGSCWCQCCKQTNSPDGSATVLTELNNCNSTHSTTPLTSRKATIRRQMSEKIIPEEPIEVELHA